MAHPKAWDGRIPVHELSGDIVWVEIPKAGSTSVKIALANALRGGSFTDDTDLHDWFGYTYAANQDELHDWLTDRWRDRWKFCVLRDPAARFVSLYYEKIDPHRYGSINAWIQGNADSWWWDDIHAVPQTQIVGDLADYTYVGRIEDSLDVEAHLSARVGEHVKLGHHNATNGDREPLDPLTVRLLEARYAEDYAVLGPRSHSMVESHG